MQALDVFLVGQEHGLKPGTTRHFFFRHMRTQELGVLGVIDEEAKAVADDGVLAN
jgi:hypothetical protein